MMTEQHDFLVEEQENGRELFDRHAERQTIAVAEGEEGKQADDATIRDMSVRCSVRQSRWSLFWANSLSNQQVIFELSEV